MTNRPMRSGWLLLLAVLLFTPSFAMADADDDDDDDDDFEGTVETIDAAGRTLVVSGRVFLTDDRTDYDDGLNDFEDVRVGDRVEVDYVSRDGQYFAREIERDD